MRTEIHSNGSRWAGEEPATLEELFEVLQREPLRPMFEQNGTFWESLAPHPHCASDAFTDKSKVVRFSGNFAYLSHVFNIDTDDPCVIARMGSAIRANMETPAYAQAKREWEEGEKREQERREQREREYWAKQARDARATLRYARSRQ